MTEVVRRKRRLPPPPTRYEKFADGTLDVADLDDEEVTRMQLRDKNGNFNGQPPKSLPREFMQLIQAEQHKRFQKRWSKMVAIAENTIAEIMASPVPQANDSARIAAARYVIDRFAGKVPDNVNIQAEVKGTFEANYASMLIDVDTEEDEEED